MSATIRLVLKPPVYLLMIIGLIHGSAGAQQRTYCNPINIDYG
jgi:hypothetical protein